MIQENQEVCNNGVNYAIRLSPTDLRTTSLAGSPSRNFLSIALACYYYKEVRAINLMEHPKTQISKIHESPDSENGF